MDDRNRCSADMGGKAVAVNLERLAACNQNYRTALWTGERLQVTLMCIPVGGDVGAEMHCDTDQLLYVVSGCALAVTGPCRNRMNDRRKITEGCAALIPLLTLLAVIPVTALWGRFFCGYLCAFGGMQELLAFIAKKLHIKQLKIRPEADRVMRNIKYGVLAALFALWTFSISYEFISPWSVFGQYSNYKGWSNLSGWFSVGGQLLIAVSSL